MMTGLVSAIARSIVAIAILIVLVVLIAKFIKPFQYAPEDYSREIVDAEAIDCGTVPVCDDRSGAIKCMADSYKSRKPFSVWFYMPSIDSKTAFGYASPEGVDLYGMIYDSDRTGGVLYLSDMEYQKCETPVLDDLEYMQNLDCKWSINLAQLESYLESSNYCGLLEREGRH